MNIPFADPIALTDALVRLDTRNPSLVPGAPGEMAAVRLLAELLPQWGFKVEIQHVADGRANLLARVGSGVGRTLMFNGHLDVVGVEGMFHAPFDAERRGDYLYGRGSADMKGGVAAMCAAAARVAADALDGEILVACVADEEYESLGTRALVESGVRADAAIVTEPTRLAICPAHRGFTWVEIELRGRAAHGSRYDLGVDAILHAALVLAEVDRHHREQLVNHTHPLLGHASLHASTIEGGAGWSTYPDRCTLRIERRTLPGEPPDVAVQEVEEAIDRVRLRVPELDATVEVMGAQAPSDVAVDAPIVRALSNCLSGAGEVVRVEGLSAWTDAALLNAAGIPAICFGPGDIALAHSAEEWVGLAEVERATQILERLASEWCRSAP